MSTTVKQSAVHEPTTVPQSSAQKYQEEVKPSSEKFVPQVHSTEKPTSTTTTTTSRVRFQQSAQINITEDSVREINQLINLIVQSDYVCYSIAYYFDRADVGLYGVADFFRNCGLVKCRKAKLLMDYLVLRGGRVILDDIKKPERKEWGTPVQAFECLLNIQKSVYDAALKIYETAEKNNDAHLTDFLEKFTLRPLSMWIRRIAVIISNTEKAGPTLGVYQLNKHLCYNMQLFFETDKEITDFLDQ